MSARHRIERHALVVGVRPERREEYLELHRNVWPQVEAADRRDLASVVSRVPRPARHIWNRVTDPWSWPAAAEPARAVRPTWRSGVLGGRGEGPGYRCKRTGSLSPVRRTSQASVICVNIASAAPAGS
ncbi:L-rhamnose mutarotase [Sphaerisporangium album]|uniref:L-rhamnose mutarotase n=1 Tax=Sphaerisporangium album TaxID=509200 RepID=UPI001C693E43